MLQGLGSRRLLSDLDCDKTVMTHDWNPVIAFQGGCRKKHFEMFSAVEGVGLVKQQAANVHERLDGHLMANPRTLNPTPQTLSPKI